MTIFLLSDQEEPEVRKHLSSLNRQSGTNHEDDSVNDGRKSRKERKEVPMCENLSLSGELESPTKVFFAVQFTLHSQAQLPHPAVRMKGLFPNVLSYPG